MGNKITFSLELRFRGKMIFLFLLFCFMVFFGLVLIFFFIVNFLKEKDTEKRELKEGMLARGKHGGRVENMGNTKEAIWLF